VQEGGHSQVTPQKINSSSETISPKSKEGAVEAKKHGKTSGLSI